MEEEKQIYISAVRNQETDGGAIKNFQKNASTIYLVVGFSAMAIGVFLLLKNLYKK